MSQMPSSDDSNTADRVSVPLDEAIRRLAHTDGRVHTFRDAGIALVGADWDLEDLIAAMRKYGVDESGPSATQARHGLVLIDERGPLFIETLAAQPPAERQGEEAGS